MENLQRIAKKIFNIVWGKEERAREKEKKDIKSIVFKLKEQGKTEEEISDYLIKKEYSVKEIETSFKEKSKWNKKELLETIKREKEELKKLEKPIFSLYDEQGMVSSKLVIFIFLCLLGIVPGVIYLFWTISNKDSKKELIRVLEEDLKKLK